MEVRVLGAVEVDDGASIVRLAPAERTVLAALASRSGERVAVDVLEEALWPADRPAAARKSLQVHVARLRRAIGPATIVERSGGYLLDTEHVDVDARRVAVQLRDARAAIGEGDHAAAIAMLHEAKRAFRGEPYADVPETALPAGELHRLEELHAAVVEEAIEAVVATGGGERCLGELEAWLERNPLRERAWGQLMRALYQAGRPADALAAYGRARLVLAAELGLEPGPALRELERAILSHDRRLLAEATERLGPSNLPAPLSPIIGRQTEIATLERLLEDNRLVTLTGAGGIGKTRLAVDFATRSIGRDESGPYFLDLVPVASVDLVPAALAATFGVEVEAVDRVMERVRAVIGSISVLVVIDNCEHLLPGLAEMVAGLLSSCAGVRVLATSREPLDVAGERVWPLSPLAVPPVGASSDQVNTSDAGALFLSRLPVDVASRPFTGDDVDAVAAVCRSLEGIPLGLELAAARSRTLSLPDLAARLDRSIEDLVQPGHGVVPRHRTMHAALDWGARLLSPPAQTALRAMSVFSGGCDLGAFADVCIDGDGPPAEEVIDELVRTSFATVDFEFQPPRYRLLEPVRQYAAELLDLGGQREERRRRHLEHYVALAEVLHGPGDEPTVRPLPLERWQRDLGNFRAVLDWSAEAAERGEAGLRLAAAMYDVWANTAHGAEGVSRTLDLLCTGGGSADTRSAAARAAGIVAFNMEDHDVGVDLLEEALTEALAGASDPLQEGRARQVLAHVYAEHGDIPAARRQLEAALELRSERAEEGLREFCLVSQMIVDVLTANLDAAAATAEEVIHGPFGTDGWIGSSARAVLGQVLLERGDVDGARSWATEGLALCESLGEFVEAIAHHLDLVAIECAAGCLEDAEAHFGAALGLLLESGTANDRWFLMTQAELSLHGGDAPRAAGLAAAAFARAEELSQAHDRCLSLRTLGDAQLAAGDDERAMSAFEQLIAGARAAPYPCREAEGHEGAAAAAGALGRRRVARRHLAAAAEIRQRTGTRRVGRPWIDQRLAALEAVAAARPLRQSEP